MDKKITLLALASLPLILFSVLMVGVKVDYKISLVDVNIERLEDKYTLEDSVETDEDGGFYYVDSNNVNSKKEYISLGEFVWKSIFDKDSLSALTESEKSQTYNGLIETQNISDTNVAVYQGIYRAVYDAGSNVSRPSYAVTGLRVLESYSGRNQDVLPNDLIIGVYNKDNKSYSTSTSMATELKEDVCYITNEEDKNYNIEAYTTVKIMRDGEIINKNGDVVTEEDEYNEEDGFKVYRNVIQYNNDCTFGIDYREEIELKNIEEDAFVIEDVQSTHNIGLSLALSIFNKATSVDIIEDNKVMAIGTINKSGTIISPSSLEAEEIIKIAINNDMDILAVHRDDFALASNLASKYNSDIKIISATTFSNLLKEF